MWSEIMNFIGKNIWIVAVFLFSISLLFTIIVVKTMAFGYMIFFTIWAIIFSVAALIVIIGCMLDRWKTK